MQIFLGIFLALFLIEICHEIVSAIIGRENAYALSAWCFAIAVILACFTQWYAMGILLLCSWTLAPRVVRLALIGLHWWNSRS